MNEHKSQFFSFYFLLILIFCTEERERKRGEWERERVRCNYWRNENFISEDEIWSGFKLNIESLSPSFSLFLSDEDGETELTKTIIIIYTCLLCAWKWWFNHGMNIKNTFRIKINYSITPKWIIMKINCYFLPTYFLLFFLSFSS